MSAEEVLRKQEETALNKNQIISHVSGKKKSKKKKSGTALFFIITMLLVVVIFFGMGTMIPAGISERLIEATDMQYADAVESKILVFQQAMYDGDIPNDTAEILKKNGVLVGYSEDEKFIEKNKRDGELSLSYNGKIISAKNFVNEVHNDAGLYSALNLATYSRAAYYYDDSAQKVFKDMGVSRNNFSGNGDFEEVVRKIVEGGDFTINNVTRVERIDENGNKYYDYEEDGMEINASDVSSLISEISARNTASSENEATLNAADQLNSVDAMAKKQRSEKFFVAFMENFSKMKAGEGNNSKINEAMNYLYRSTENEVVDVKTGEVVKEKGSMLESPSLYALLSGSKVDFNKTDNYSSERVLKTVENQLGVREASKKTLSGTVISSDARTNATIGRYINDKTEKASVNSLSKVDKTLESSLGNKSLRSLQGISGGELLVEGAVNVGAELAKASGGSYGDEEAIKSYAGLTETILALDANADRLSRSPFDITSKNTFLGSIVYNLAMSMSRKGIFGNFGVILRTTGNSMRSFLPLVFAEDGKNGFLTNFGECERANLIGAKASSGCIGIITFDTSTLNNPYDNKAFNDFVEKNTTLDAFGNRTINSDSVLAEFILNNGKRTTPIGMTDGGILESLNDGGFSIPFASNIVEMIKNFVSASDRNKKIASGEMFVNSRENENWQTYKYAQRYVSMARAESNLSRFSNDPMAYSSVKYFEGTENPVIAFLKKYNEQTLANK